MTNYIDDTNLHQYEAGYADGFDAARNGRRLMDPSFSSPYWNGYHDGAIDAEGTYA